CNIEDDQHEDHKHDYSKTNIKRITIKDAVVNTNAFNKLTKPTKQIKNINGRVINDTINNFSIETESGTYIEKENYHSYTFKVIRENGSDFLLENIVVDKYNDSDYRTFLYQYDITQDELNLINNNQYVDLNNKISIIVLENSSISNYLNTNSKIDYNSMCYVSNTYYVEGSFICPLGNHNYSNYPSCDFFKDGTVLPTHGNWATDVSLTPCVDAGGINNTDAGNESPSGENGGSGTGGSSTTTPTTTNYQKLREKCITENNPEVSSWLNQPENADIKNDVIDYLENSVNPDGLQSTESCYDESSEEFQNVMDMYDILDDGMVNGEPILVGPDVPIYDMAEYLSCFNTSLGATITIYADQPTSGAHDLLGDDGVGHAFVSIKQGTNIATLGFYPISTTGSVFGATPGIYGNDQNHSYDVSISVSVSSIKLTQIIGNLISNTDPIYELHQYNCTDVAVGIGNVSGMNIPSCESPSVWNGDTPGTLGEMIRNMPTPSGGSKNLTGGNAPLNNCN
ncbi:MAG: hypothetical protein ABNG96_06310, partial [Flavobacterium sp.]